MTLKAGDAAPAFQAMDQNGTMHTLAQYHGKWLLLYFYPKDDTPGCTQEACNFRDNIDLLNDRAVVLGVSADSVESHKSFEEKYQLNFPLLADPDQAIIHAYGTNSMLFKKRTTFLIDPEGTIKKIYENVDPMTHIDEILEDLGALDA